MVELINAIGELFKLVGPVILVVIILGAIILGSIEIGKLRAKAAVSEKQGGERESETEKIRAESDAKTLELVKELQQRLTDQHGHQMKQADEITGLRNKLDDALKAAGEARKVAENLERENKKHTERLGELETQVGELQKSNIAQHAEIERLTKLNDSLIKQRDEAKQEAAIERGVRDILTNTIIAKIQVLTTGEVPAAKVEPTPVAESPALETVKEG